MTLESFAQWFIDLDLLQRYGPRMLEEIGRAHV